MSEVVVPLHGGSLPLAQGEPNEKIVLRLEELLAAARTGHITAIAWCAYKSGVDTCSQGWVTGHYAFHLGSAVLLLHHCYGKFLDEEAMELPPPIIPPAA